MCVSGVADGIISVNVVSSTYLCVSETTREVTVLVGKPPPLSTQHCISTGSLNRVPASVVKKAGKVPLPGGR